MNILYLNARSINRKLNDLELLASDKKPDLILITETWLNDSTPNSILNIPNYYIDSELRIDRSDTLNGIGGGLLVYVRIGLTVLSCDNKSAFNQYCNFKLLNDDNSTNFNVTLFYRSPNSTSANTELLCDIIDNLNENELNVLVGDFNMPEIDWNKYKCPVRYDRFLDTLSSKNLSQLVNFTTHNKGNILDLALTNSPECVLNIENIGNLGNSDHCIISIDIVCDMNEDKGCDYVHDWSNANIASFSRYLQESNIVNNMQGKNIDNSWDLFKNLVHSGIELYVPKKLRRVNTRPVWVNKRVIQLSRQKRRRFAIYCKDRTDANLNIYKKVEKACKRAVRNSKRKFEQKLAKDTNKKPFNAYMRTKTKNRVSVGPLKEGNQIIKDNGEIAKILNKYFASVFTSNVNTAQPDLPTLNDVPVLSNFTVTKKTVIEKIKGLKNTSSCGPDDLSNLVLKTFVNELAEPLAVIFNKSVSESSVPEDWRLGNITPIFKKGSKGSPANYRPVSLTSIPCKILESIIKDQVVEHLELNLLLRSSQHGFLKGKSCTTNLLEFIENVLNITDDNIPVDIIYLDFAKAFDKVPTSRLLSKIKALNIDGKILGWITSWLTNRKQRVVLHGVKSLWLAVLSGVPQGSVLGPLLFLIFINDIDLAASLVRIFSKFADDTKLGHPVLTERDKNTLQSQLDSLCTWAEQWGMEFNVSKCKVMHIGRRNQKFV